LHLSGAPLDSTVSRQVIGVVPDVRPSATSDPVPAVYVSSEQTNFFGNEFVVRTSGDANALVGTLRGALHALAPALPLVLPRTMRDVLADSIRREQLAMALMGMFAALTLVLAAVGVYGIMAYTVVRRTREIGIRTALGASPREILALVLRNAATTAGAGIMVGLVLASLAVKYLSSILVGVSTHDLATYAEASALLLGAALLACIVPARAAMRISPSEAIRLEE